MKAPISKINRTVLKHHRLLLDFIKSIAHTNSQSVPSPNTTDSYLETSSKNGTLSPLPQLYLQLFTEHNRVYISELSLYRTFKTNKYVQMHSATEPIKKLI